MNEEKDNKLDETVDDTEEELEPDAVNGATRGTAHAWNELGRDALRGKP